MADTDNGGIPPRFIIDGRKQFGLSFVKRARDELHSLEKHMKYNSLALSERVVKVNDDLHILISVTGPQRTVTILTDPWIVRERCQRHRECPTGVELTLAYVVQVNGMQFDQSGIPSIWPALSHGSKGVTYDLLVCMGLSYDLWEGCQPVDWYPFDHVDHPDTGFTLQVGEQVLATPVWSGGVVSNFKILNMFTTEQEKWIITRKCQKYRALRY